MDTISTNKLIPFKAKRIVLYVPPTQLLKINGVPNELIRIVEQFKQYQLYRIYVLLDFVYCTTGQDMAYDLQCREVHTFNTQNKNQTLLMLYFSNIEYQKYWKRVENIKAETIKLIDKKLNIKQDKVIDIVFLEFSNGVHTCNSHRLKNNYFPNNFSIFIGHEAYGQQIGQIESTLSVANSIIDHIKSSQ